ncbi:hypothetical protein BGX34_001893 [Mortierella sp. NVP85]|nr:hypothetical protein BGX34_001893 [Mortierella sp. NVP85]
MHRKHPLLQRVGHLYYIIPILFSLSILSFVQAQLYQPYLTVQMGTTFVDGKALYVLGGFNYQRLPSSQTFMIDLSVSWNTSSPVYKELKWGTSCLRCPAAMSSDGRRLLVFAYQVGLVYEVQANMWTQFLSYVDVLGWVAVTDPVTGKVFIPCVVDNTVGQATTGMMIMDSKGYDYRIDNTTSASHSWKSTAITWNAVLKKVLFANEYGMYSYTPEEGWKEFARPPGLRADYGYCMVSSSSGSKVVLFGGYSKGLNVTVNDIFILDTATLSWNNGTMGGPARRDAACAMSGDYFVAWGGDTGDIEGKIVPPPPGQNPTIVYNVKADKWTSDYAAPAVNTKSATPSSPGESRPTDTSPEGDTSDASGTTGSIIGAFVGACAIVLLIFRGIVGYRAYKERSKASPSDVATNNEYVEDDRRRETVQVGLFGTQYEEQHPHACLSEIQGSHGRGSGAAA